VELCLLWDRQGLPPAQLCNAAGAAALPAQSVQVQQLWGMCVKSNRPLYLASLLASAQKPRCLCPCSLLQRHPGKWVMQAADPGGTEPPAISIPSIDEVFPLDKCLQVRCSTRLQHWLPGCSATLQCGLWVAVQASLWCWLDLAAPA